LGHETEFKGITYSLDVIGVKILLVRDAFKGTVLDTGLWIWAELVVP
jgi:hypothetical protein